MTCVCVCPCVQIEVQERLPLTNFKGAEVGQLTVEALPCLQDGSLPEDSEVFLEDPTELIGKPLHFMLKINQATGLPSRFNKVRTVHPSISVEVVQTGKIIMYACTHILYKLARLYTITCNYTMPVHLNHDHLMKFTYLRTSGELTVEQC